MRRYRNYSNDFFKKEIIEYRIVSNWYNSSETKYSNRSVKFMFELFKNEKGEIIKQRKFQHIF